ncbi:MAG: hypothetical protein IJC52_04090 [Clostridia bacterium]|nr:hypothetical protein [Clostridia bacterium]
MTQKLYETDAYCRHFEATVLSCEPQGDAFAVVLDQTAFFPEGGGQAPDGGTLGGATVTDVQPDGDTVVHTVSSPLEAGTTVCGEIDWPLRFSRMQSHAGEHIVSGVIHAMFGYDNVGFHMSETTMTVDVNGPLTAEDIDRIERAANEAVWQNVTITVSFPTAEELQTIPYRSKLDFTDGVRLITIDGVDCCACCAPHPARTGEIGAIKLLDFFPNKGGTRIEMTAGVHALADYAALHKANKTLMGMLSAKRDGVADAVQRQLDTAGQLRAENAKLSRELAVCKLTPTAVAGGVFAVAEGLSYDDMRFVANDMVAAHAKCVLLSRAAGDDYLYVVSSAEAPIADLVKALNAAFSGKGGGRPTYAQGKITAPSKEDLIAKVTELLNG